MNKKIKKPIKNIIAIPLYTTLGFIFGFYLFWLFGLIFIKNGSTSLGFIYLAPIFITIGTITGIIIGIKRSQA